MCRLLRLRQRFREKGLQMNGVVYGRWNIIQRGKSKGQVDLGETPQAYKDIQEVINNQSDLVEPIVKLRPLGVIKG